MIDFSPLFETLDKKGMNISDLRGEVASPATLTSIKQGHMTTGLKLYLSTIENICLYLEVPIEKVVKITKD